MMKKNGIIIIVIMIVMIQSRIPQTFDLRIQPSIIKYANYSVPQLSICTGYEWASQLASVISNAYSMILSSRSKLSISQILSCISSQTDKCHYNTLDNLHNAIKYIQNNPITTQECYPNQPLSLNVNYCRRVCANGFPFPENIKSIVVNHSSSDEMLDKFVQQDNNTAFVIYKVFDNMNYYSYQNSNITFDGSIYGYGIAEVVGWKANGDQLIVKTSAGKGWGYGGFAYISVNNNNSPIIQFYTLKIALNQEKYNVKEE